MPKSKTAIGASLIVLSSLFYASYGIWTTLMGDFFGGYTASAHRGVLVLSLLIPIALLYRKIGPFNFRKNWQELTGMIAASGLIWGLLYYSVLEAGIGLSFTFNYAAIVIGMLTFGWLFAGEKLTQDKLWSVFLGIVGLFLVYIPTATTSSRALPLIAAFVSGLAVAANTVIAKKLPYNTTQSTLVLWAASVIANVPLVFILNEPSPNYGWHIEWLYLIFFSIASILATWLVLRGMKYVEAGIAGILGLLEIVFSIIFGIVIFNENIEAIAVLGVVVVLFAAAFPYFRLADKIHDRVVSIKGIEQ